MAATPPTIFIDTAHTALERAQARGVQQELLNQAVDQGSKNILAAVGMYEKEKADTMKMDLLGFGTASTLAGGPDKLPADTRNRLPGILGFELPRDANGDVVVTPDLDTLIKRQGIEALQKDPSLAKKPLGWEKPAEDPNVLAATNRKTDLDAATKMYVQKMKSSDAANHDAARVQAAWISASGRIKSAGLKEAALDQPSPFYQDPANGRPITGPEWNLQHPGEAPPKPLSFRAAKSISDGTLARAKEDEQNSIRDLNDQRTRKLTGDIDFAMNDPSHKYQGQLKSMKELNDLILNTTDPKMRDSAKPVFEKMARDLLISMGSDPKDIDATAASHGGFWNMFTGVLNSANAYPGTYGGVNPGGVNTAGAPSLSGPTKSGVPGVPVYSDPAAINTYFDSILNPEKSGK